MSSMPRNEDKVAPPRSSRGGKRDGWVSAGEQMRDTAMQEADSSFQMPAPTLRQEAFHGPLGRIALTIQPHTS
jgi:hypothetical protein